jgi:hypothetical protein
LEDLPRLSPIDSGLLAMSPLTASSVLDVDAADDRFGRHYATLNPTARYTRVRSVAEESRRADVIILRAAARAGEADRLVAWASERLAPGGYLLLALAPGEHSLTLSDLSLVRSSAVEMAGSDPGRVMCLARPSDIGVPLNIHYRFMARTLMDIRTHLPASALARDPRLRVTTQDGREPFFMSKLGRDAPKILVSQRPRSPPGDEWLVATSKLIRNGWISVIEYDDHPVATAAVIGAPVTEEGLRHFSHYHAVQTSTPALKSFFSAYSPEVGILPNSVFELPPPPRRSGPPKVFYGGVTRGPIATEVAASLAGSAGRFPDVQFVVIGDKAMFDALPTANKVFHPYRPYAEYLAIMRECEISLSPLTESVGNSGKSDAKFLDAARNAMVFLASPAVYASSVEHGRTGFIVETIEDWDRTLSELLADEDRRREVGRNAWEYVRSCRMFAGHAAETRNWYQSLWDRRQELTSMMLEREPRLRAMFARP